MGCGRNLDYISDTLPSCCPVVADLGVDGRSLSCRGGPADLTSVHCCTSGRYNACRPFFNPPEIIPQLIQSERRPSDADATTGFAKYLINH